MKLENNWKHKTIENLEKSYWITPTSESRLIKRINELRRIPINELEIEDLRLLISQNVGLEYLVHITMKKLKDNILAEGDFYKGDLLLAVINCSDHFWIEHSQMKAEILSLVNDNLDQLKREGIKIQWDK